MAFFIQKISHDIVGALLARDTFHGNKHGKGFPITMLKKAIDKIGF
jgi:hypothetical protein